ncbi:MAG: DNA polymerase IV [Armatimonadota bacterium]|nr:MAG: DNA polymerase IV [Armatimonadota bacterium]
MRGGRRRETERARQSYSPGMASRIIIHVDMDAFYAAVEQRDRPELRGRPVIVGGTPEGRGVVSAASYEAREFGVHSAMPAAQAVRACPQGAFLPVDMRKYRRVSEEVMAILGLHAGVIEQVSIDEAFLEVTDRARDFAAAARIARSIKREIRGELKLTASVGVGPNKFLAKLASDLEKPDGLVVIEPHEAEGFLAPLPVGKLWGVGPKTEKRLQERGLKTIGQVAGTPVEELRKLLGPWGDVVHELARGIDERAVEPVREAKSASAEQTFPEDLDNVRDMRKALAELSREVAGRLQGEGVRARTVAIKVRFGDFRTITRQTTLGEATDQAEVLRQTAYRLLDGVDRAGQGIRLLGVRGAGLEQALAQLSLFDEQAQRRGQLERTLSYIRRRFGPEAVRWAREGLRQK